LQNEAEGLAEEWSQRKPLDGVQKPEDALQIATQYKHRFNQLQRKMNWLSENAFEESVAFDAFGELHAICKLWAQLEVFNATVIKYRVLLWRSVNAAQLNSNLAELEDATKTL